MVLLAAVVLAGAVSASAQQATPPPRDETAYGGRLAKARASDWPECVRLLEPLVRQGVEDGPVLARFGQCLSMSGRTAQAEEVLRRCMQKNPGFEPCLNGLGAALMDQGRWTEAKGFFERAAQVSFAAGRYTASFEWLIQGFLDRRQLQSARRYLQVASSLAPDDRIRARLEVFKARLALETGDGEAALHHLEAARAHLDFGMLPVLHGLVLAWLGRFDTAARELAALHRDPPRLSPLDREVIRLAPDAFSGGAAPGTLKKLIERFPSRQEAWFVAAAAAHVEGRQAHACELLARAREHVTGSRSLLAPPWATCPGPLQEGDGP